MERDTIPGEAESDTIRFPANERGPGDVESDTIRFPTNYNVVTVRKRFGSGWSARNRLESERGVLGR